MLNEVNINPDPRTYMTSNAKIDNVALGKLVTYSCVQCPRVLEKSEDINFVRFDTKMSASGIIVPLEKRIFFLQLVFYLL